MNPINLMTFLTLLNCKKGRVLCQTEIMNAYGEMDRFKICEKEKVSEIPYTLSEKSDTGKFLQKGFREGQTFQLSRRALQS